MKTSGKPKKTTLLACSGGKHFVSTFYDSDAHKMRSVPCCDQNHTFHELAIAKKFLSQLKKTARVSPYSPTCAELLTVGKTISESSLMEAAHELGIKLSKATDDVRFGIAKSSLNRLGKTA